MDKEREGERAKQPIHQSDNGSELKNKIMREALQAMGVEERHSREYTPSTNGKIENRVKQVARRVASELGGDLKEKTQAELKKALRSALAILNSNPVSLNGVAPYKVTTCPRRPPSYEKRVTPTSLSSPRLVPRTHARRWFEQAAHHAVPERVLVNGYSTIKKGKLVSDEEIIHMVDKMRFAQSSKARSDKARQEATVASKPLAKASVSPARRTNAATCLMLYLLRHSAGLHIKKKGYGHFWPRVGSIM